MLNLFLFLFAAFDLYGLFSPERFRRSLEKSGPKFLTAYPTFERLYWALIFINFGALVIAVGWLPTILIGFIYFTFWNSEDARASVKALFKKIFR